MKKVLCDKDEKFLSIHDEDCTLTKLEDGDCLTHEDGTKNNLYYNEKEKCFKKLRWRAKISNSYYYINWNRFVICKTTEEENESDNLRYKNLNYFQTKKEAYTKLFAVKSVLND